MEKRLNKKNKIIFGVCGGLGDYFKIDPTIIRLIFVAALILYGSGLLLYLIMAIVMPNESAS